MTTTSIPATGETLHRMGDVGYIDEQGRLWFCGRKSQRVVTPHGTLFTDMVEPVFNYRKPASRTALVGVERDGRTFPVLCYEVGQKHLNFEEQIQLLKERALCFEHTRNIAAFLQYDQLSFPVDVRHNSKIFREKLAVWADRKLGPKWNGGPA